jgi:glutamate N-acetyltransferase/amino-acid N-acetyltransferase
LDLGLLVADGPAVAAGAFTQNKLTAAPVIVGRRHVAAGRLRAVVVNSGNANAATGAPGLSDAEAMCRVAGEAVGCGADEVLPSSTGIIGVPLPMDRIEAGIRQAAGHLGNSASHAAAFAQAIMTTDAFPKTAATTVQLNGRAATVAGVAKGAGMIGPDMAVAAPPPTQGTMLAFLTTDVRIEPQLLRTLLPAAVGPTFNRISVDGHTSTNDTVLILASGTGPAVETDEDVAAFTAALREVMTHLAKLIARDGEGATKLMDVRIEHAASDSEADVLARTIAASPLVKTALHGCDPNWGRIVSAAGYAPAAFDPDRATLSVMGVEVFRHGIPLPFDAAAVSGLMRAADEVEFRLDCGLGDGSGHHWSCDLTRDYVRINAEYTT